MTRKREVIKSQEKKRVRKVHAYNNPRVVVRKTTVYPKTDTKQAKPIQNLVINLLPH